MSEDRKKFDDDQATREKIAAAPDITIDKNELNTEKEPVKEHVSTDCEPVKSVPDDPKTDERNTRLLVKCVNSYKPLDEDLSGALEEFGQNLWPLLRMSGMGWKPYTIIVGFLSVAPLAPSGFRILTGLFRRKEENDNGST